MTVTFILYKVYFKNPRKMYALKFFQDKNFKSDASSLGFAM